VSALVSDRDDTANLIDDAIRSLPNSLLVEPEVIVLVVAAALKAHHGEAGRGRFAKAWRQAPGNPKLAEWKSAHEDALWNRLRPSSRDIERLYRLAAAHGWTADSASQ
jgi:hypothetical protein